MEPRGRVHPLVHVALLEVQVAVEVDDPDAPVDVRGEAADVRVADRMVAAEDDGENLLGREEGDRAVDLVERLLDVRRDDEDVSGIDEVELLVEVHGQLDGVSVVERRDPADRLGPEAATGPVGSSHVERSADDRDLVATDLVDVLDIGRLAECVDPGERGLRTARERRDRPVLHRGRRFESILERALDRVAMPAVGDVREFADVSRAAEAAVGASAVIHASSPSFASYDLLS